MSPAWFGIGGRWTSGEFAVAKALLRQWQELGLRPGERDTLTRVYWSLEFCSRWRPFTRYQTYHEMLDYRVRLVDFCTKVFPCVWVVQSTSRRRIENGQSKL